MLQWLLSCFWTHNLEKLLLQVVVEAACNDQMYIYVRKPWYYNWLCIICTEGHEMKSIFQPTSSIHKNPFRKDLQALNRGDLLLSCLWWQRYRGQCGLNAFLDVWLTAWWRRRRCRSGSGGGRTDGCPFHRLRNHGRLQQRRRLALPVSQII